MLKLSQFLLHKTSSLYSHSSRHNSTFNKVCSSIEEALSDIKDGQTILAGGFGLCGVPENLYKGIRQKGTKNLTIISNNAGVEDFGFGILIQNRQIKRAICSGIGENNELGRQYITGEIELEFVPQGTLAEKCRAGGAGIPAFYTPTGVGTIIEKGGFPIKFKKGGKEAEIVSEPRKKTVFNGKEYLLEPSFFGDVALIKAYKADTKGNLVFNKTAKNMNKDFATAAKIVIVEAEEIVEAGEIDPNDVHLPGVFVSKVVKGPQYERRIYTTPKRKASAAASSKSEAQLQREKIAERACKEIKNGMYINLGIGIPTLIPAMLPKEVEIELQSENGVLGVGEFPKTGEEDPDLVNAGKESITAIMGSSFFSSSESFGMIRGRHLDVTILGGMQVSASGDLANWIVPGSLVKGMGGAMDLVGSGTKVIVTMEHTAKGGEHKILNECSLPLTGKGVVDILVTEMATFEFINGEMILKEIEKGYSLDDIKKNTGCEFKIANGLRV